MLVIRREARVKTQRAGLHQQGSGPRAEAACWNAKDTTMIMMLASQRVVTVLWLGNAPGAPWAAAIAETA